MNHIYDNTTMLAMVRSALFMFYFMESIKLFIANRSRKSYVSVMACILLLWSMEMLKDAVSQFYPWFTLPYVRCLYMLIDITVIPLCSIFVWTMLYRDWLTLRRLAFHLSPFVACIVAYVFTRAYWVWIASFGVATIYCLVMSVQLTKAMRAFDKMLNTNYSYRENINLDWLKRVIIVFLGNLVFCNLLYLHPSNVLFLFYYAYCMAMWIFIISNTYRQRLYLVRLDIEPDTTDADTIDGDCNQETDTPKWETEIVRLFETERIYLHSCLTIKDVATLAGTNRSYLSNYFNNVRHTTFYDFVNDYRLAHACQLLRDTQKKVTDVCTESGFNSFATFARTFKKKYGYSPTQFRQRNR